MLRWTLILLAISIVAAVFSFAGISAAGLVEMLFFTSIVFFLIVLIARLSPKPRT